MVNQAHPDMEGFWGSYYGKIILKN